MIEFVIHFLNTSVLPVVHQLGYWFYVLVALAAIFESTFILGTFIPGTIILLFFGFTAAAGDISLYGVILATAVGAILGDFISYFIGRYGSSFIKENKGLLRISHIEIGKAFFHKHGGKSVLLGRFISPIRQIIPFIAGAVYMPYRKFVILNVVGAFLWAISYILLGYYFGANGELIDKVISRIGIVFTALIVGAGIYFFNRRRGRKLEDLAKGEVAMEELTEKDTTADLL
ncbi:MAG: DedA family protein [Candidatus Pacebacteria bacterium]|nr:DedA family protein [Candidatus Paceibacterota bacterium]MBP9818599.1 DedA family protein [Candidatus Paceibacterota bacterium]